MKLGKAAVLVMVSAFGPATMLAAHGQYTGVSHPEQVPVTTSSEGIAQPLVYDDSAVQAGSTAVATAAATTAASGAVATTTIPVPPTTPALRDTLPGKPVVPAASAAIQPAPRLRSHEPRMATAAAMAPEAVQPRAVKADPTERDDAAAMHAEVAADGDRAFLDGRTHAEPEDTIVTRVPGPSNQLPLGTLLRVRLKGELSTGRTRAGEPFHAELAMPVLRDGRVLLPAGSLVDGQVTDVHGGRRVSGAASMHLRPTSVTLPDGTRYEIKAQLIDTELYRSTRVAEDGTLVKRDHAGRTVAVIGLAAGSSAAAGAVFGGWPGAVIGAGVGAGVGTVMWLKKDRQTEMPVNTKLVFSLSKPLVVGGE